MIYEKQISNMTQIHLRRRFEDKERIKTRHSHKSHQLRVILPSCKMDPVRVCFPNSTLPRYVIDIIKDGDRSKEAFFSGTVGEAYNDLMGVFFKDLNVSWVVVAGTNEDCVTSLASNE